MANTRIADLPLASTIDSNTFLATDTLGAEGTRRATPSQVVTPTAQNVVDTRTIIYSTDTTDSNISSGMTIPQAFARIEHLLGYIYLTDTELDALETALGI